MLISLCRTRYNCFLLRIFNLADSWRPFRQATSDSSERLALIPLSKFRGPKGPHNPKEANHDGSMGILLCIWRRSRGCWLWSSSQRNTKTKITAVPFRPSAPVNPANAIPAKSFWPFITSRFAPRNRWPFHREFETLPPTESKKIRWQEPQGQWRPSQALNLGALREGAAIKSP